MKAFKCFPEKPCKKNRAKKYIAKDIFHMFEKLFKMKSSKYFPEKTCKKNK